MSKYHEIVNNILEIEDGLFQTICDEVLYLTEQDCNRIFRPGSQAWTNKTKPSTADTYFVLTNDQYVLVEYTTQSPRAISALLKKIKEDNDKCTDLAKTGLAAEDISKLITGVPQIFVQDIGLSANKTREFFQGIFFGPVTFPSEKRTQGRTMLFW